MLDLSAAFDTIDHRTLLHRLEHMFGIAGKPLEWMSSYPSGRYQTVTIDGKLSEPVKMTFSVPQGSVLGPKFYTIYTTPVGAICKKHGLFSYHFYADDSQLYLSFKPTDQVTGAEAIRRVEVFVCFVALRPKSTAMVIAGRSVHRTTLFPGQA